MCVALLSGIGLYNWPLVVTSVMTVHSHHDTRVQNESGIEHANPTSTKAQIGLCCCIIKS